MIIITGGCKHAVALLMWLHRRNEESKPTATVCYWTKATLCQVGTNLKFIRVTDIKKPIKTCDLLNNDNFFKNVVEELKKRQLSLHWEEVVQELEKKWSICLDNCGLLLRPEYPIIGASPDAVGSDFVLEIKCLVSKKTE
ncbi:hypothetical protein ILUMI_21721 [Ignelater luminosus]|uniref:YqaJ viral recombinase domain-containing protein n=1 Tax=Ignelater luminosus TaxID=2038154 RepID=A0A8K0CIF0_IGNLU|nr:hypothetical protein ILUMI_21721 [Ignelater luminosus]